MIQYIALPIVGFLIGLVIISFGGGGGAFYVGILTVFFNISPAVAASSSLATMIPTTAAGAFSHWRAGNINLKLGIYMICGGVVGSVVGCLCSGLLPIKIYSKISGIFLILISLQILYPYIKKRKKHYGDGNEANSPRLSRITKALAFGFIGGAMSGIVGLSGGSPVIAGLSVLGCSAMEMVGTSVFVLFAITVTGFLMHLGLGNINWPLVCLLLIGTVSGAVVGPLTLKKINKDLFSKFMGPAVFISTVSMGIMLLLK